MTWAKSFGYIETGVASTPLLVCVLYPSHPTTDDLTVFRLADDYFWFLRLRDQLSGALENHKNLKMAEISECLLQNLSNPSFSLGLPVAAPTSPAALHRQQWS